MQVARLSNMQGGWFAGDFSPAALRNSAFEVAVKRYRAGQQEPAHYHKVATELTVIVVGRVRMCGRELGEGDIAILDPHEATSFEALEDSVTVVVKTPSVPDDKYLVPPPLATTLIDLSHL